VTGDGLPDLKTLRPGEFIAIVFVLDVFANIT
jgi:hypothetical protein